MKLYDGGATALIVIGVIYFGDWLVNKISPPPQQCLYSHENVQTWAECGLDDEQQNKLFEVKDD